MKILKLLVINIFVLNYVYAQTVKGATSPPTVTSKVALNVPTTLKPNVSPTNFTPQFANDIVTYVEGTTEKPFVSNKKSRNFYTAEIMTYFRRNGILNCDFAFCENLENGRKEFKKVSPNAGATISTCNKKLYYVSYKSITAAEIWQQCCKYGMIPATFTSREEFDCFNAAYHKFTGATKKSSDKMFTAYIDANLDSRYISCYTMKSLPKNLWYRNEPDNEQSKQPLLGYSLAEDGFVDLFFEATLQFVCESVAENITSIPQKISTKIFNTTNVNGTYNSSVTKDLWKHHIPHCKNAFCNKVIPVNVIKDNSNIRNVTACEKSLFISKILVTYMTAWEECFKMGMTPLNIDNTRKINCLRKALYQEGTTEDTYYITTAIDVDLNGHYSSCLTGYLISSEMWAAEHPRKNEACVQFVLGANKANLVSASCNSKATLVCEDKHESYDANQAQLHKDNKIAQCKSAYCKNDPTKTKGREGLAVFNGMDKIYYVSMLIQLNYFEIWDFCCKRGLVPMSIDSIREFTYLKEKIPIAANLQYHMYLGIIDIDLDQNYVSCVTGKKIDEKIPWTGSRYIGPCTLFYLDKREAFIKSIGCDFKFNPACQTTPNISDYFMKPKFSAPFESSEVTLTTSAPVSKIMYDAVPMNYIKSKKLLNCESCFCKDPVKNANEKTEKLKDGKLIEWQCEAKQLYLLNVKIPYDLVWGECCALGLVPATIENKQLLSCLAANYFKSVPTFGNVFWTSQIDSTLNRYFISCSSGNTVPADMWLKGEPDNIDMKEACVVIKFDNKTAGLQDLRCGGMMPVLCEVPNNGADLQINQKISTQYASAMSKNAVTTTSAPNQKIVVKKGDRYKDVVINFMNKSGFLDCSIAVCNKTEEGKKYFRTAQDLDGAIISECENRVYYITKNKVGITDIWNTCCRFGMSPMSISSRKQMSCVQKSYDSIRGIANIQYWTAHVDYKMDGLFASCITGQNLPKEMWQPGQPDNFGQMEMSCIVNMARAGRVVDQPWTFKYAVICETNDTTVLPLNKKNVLRINFTSTQGSTQKVLPVTTKPVVTIKSG